MVSIPLEQGGGFRPNEFIIHKNRKLVSIPLEQGGVFRQYLSRPNRRHDAFQSLWSRAGSFDSVIIEIATSDLSFNPFGAGRGLSTRNQKSIERAESFNPFGAGRGLSTIIRPESVRGLGRFNPFGAGRGLSTAGVVWCLGG